MVRCLWSVIVVVALSSALFAQEEKKTEENERQEEATVVELEEIVVTPTGAKKSIFDAPYTVSAFDDGYLARRKQARTMPEALLEIPGVMVQKTSHGQGSPFIRGFTGFRTLLLVDGIRLNNSVFREGPNQYWNTVDPLSLARIEVVKGPASVLYGSDAIGGAVNALTLDPAISGEGFQWSRRLYSRYASAEESYVGRSQVSAGKIGSLEMLGGYNWKSFGELHGGRHIGTMEKTGYDEVDGDFKLNYFVQPDLKLVVAYQQVDQNDAWRTHRTIYGKSWRGATVGTDRQLDLDQNRQLFYAALYFDDAHTFFQKGHVTLSFHEQAEDQFRIDANNRRTIQGFEVGTYGIGSQFESSSPIGNLTYGADYYRDTVDSYRRDPDRAPTVADPNIQVSPRGPVADDAEYDMFGVFLQDEFNVAEGFDLILGVRYTYAVARADEVGLGDIGTDAFEVLPDLSESCDAVVGNMRLVYHAADELNLFCGVSQGFRAPNLSDYTGFDISRSGELETPTSGLDPEQYVSYEIGLKTATEPVGGSVSYFHTDIRDMIVRVPTGNVVDGSTEVKRVNASDGFVRGVEVEVNCALSTEWETFLRFCWQEGEVDTYPTAQPAKKRKPMSRMQPATAILGARWTDSEEKFYAEGLVTIVNEQDRLSPDDKRDTQRIPPDGTPGYTIYTLRGGMKVDENLDISVSVENIGDKDYRVLGSGQNEAGFNAIVSLDWGF